MGLVEKGLEQILGNADTAAVLNPPRIHRTPQIGALKNPPFASVSGSPPSCHHNATSASPEPGASQYRNCSHQAFIYAKKGKECRQDRKVPCTRVVRSVCESRTENQQTLFFKPGEKSNLGDSAELGIKDPTRDRPGLGLLRIHALVPAR